MLIATTLPLQASWLSDITGVNIDVPAGKFEIGKPNPAAIGEMLKNLPKDAGIAWINYQYPLGAAMAFEVRRAEAHHWDEGKPIPPHIKAALSGHFAPHILDGVRWVTYDPGVLTLGNVVIKQTLQRELAVTLNRLIVFQKQSDAETSCNLWAHELMHVVQYDQMGIEAFSTVYTTGIGAIGLESAANEIQQWVADTVACPRPGIAVGRALRRYRYAERYRGGSGRLSYAQHFVPAARSYYPAAGCIENVGFSKVEVKLRNVCSVPVTVLAWYLDNPAKKESVRRRCNCILNHGEVRTFKMPNGWPLDSAEFRY